MKCSAMVGDKTRYFYLPYGQKYVFDLICTIVSIVVFESETVRFNDVSRYLHIKSSLSDIVMTGWFNKCIIFSMCT